MAYGEPMGVCPVNKWFTTRANAAAAMFIDTDQLMYDPATGYWVARPKECEHVPETQRKCECGVWSTGGLHSDWCPCAGGDCVQKEDR